MKARYCLSIVILLALACSQGPALKTGALSLYTANPQPGEKMHFDYNKNASNLAKDTGLITILYYYVDKQLYAKQVNTVRKDDKWTGDFVIPDSAQAFALSFKAADSTDNNNGQGYIFKLYQGDSLLAGTYAAASLFYYGEAPYLLGDITNTDSAYALLKTERAINPAAAQAYNMEYLEQLVLIDKGSALKLIEQQYRDTMAKAAPEEATLNSFHSLFIQSGRQTQADSLEAIIRSRFPYGELALEDTYHHILSIQNNDSLLITAAKLQQAVPDAPAGSLARQIMNDIYSKVARAYDKAGDYYKALWYAEKNDNKLMKAGLYNNLAWEMAQAGENLSLADSLSAVSLSLIRQERDNPGVAKATYITDESWQREMNNAYGMYADTYAYILFHEENTAKALAIQQEAVNCYSENAAPPDVMGRYVQYLKANNKTDSARIIAENCVKNSNASNDIIQLLKQIYINRKGSEKGFQQYLEGLESEARKKMRKQLAKQMVNIPATGFALKDMQGNDIALNTFHGKTVVLDFWATWCGPCKASFPAMQQALNKFKDKNDVVFLFVDTWEKLPETDRKKAVTDLMGRNAYTFHVLLDRQDSTGAYKVVSNYKVKGIPTKFIIDPDGNICFKKIGFDGDDNKLVEELSLMIDMAAKTHGEMALR